jgi:AcrR family transcriptional regulator
MASRQTAEGLDMRQLKIKIKRTFVRYMWGTLCRLARLPDRLAGLPDRLAMPPDKALKAQNKRRAGHTPAPSTKKAVYEAAVALFARKGFAATGMRELSRAAGVNLATVNYFYGSKKGLLKAILEDFFTGILAILAANLAGDDAPTVKARRLVAAVARYYGAERDKMIIAMTELPHDDPEIVDFKAHWFARLAAMFQSELIAGIDEAADRPPVAVIAPAMVALVASKFLFTPLVEKARPPGFAAIGADAYPEFIADLFVDGFAGLLASRRRDG